MTTTAEKMSERDTWLAALLALTTDMLCCSAGLIHSRPEFLYFWFYFVFVNAIWILVPGIVIYRAARTIHVAIAQQR